MPWNPDHIRHIACAGRLYSLLLQQQEGLHFLQTDARGGVLQVLEQGIHFTAVFMLAFFLLAKAGSARIQSLECSPEICCLAHAAYCATLLTIDFGWGTIMLSSAP